MRIESYSVGVTPVKIYSNQSRDRGYGDVQLVLVRNTSATATVHVGDTLVSTGSSVSSVPPSSQKSYQLEVGIGDLYAVSTEAATTVHVAEGLAEL
jgi:hypothetical protein